MNDRPTRKAVLINLLALPFAAVGMASQASAAAKAPAAGAKSPQTAVSYQTSPKGTAHCSGCKFFLPGADPKAKGQCQVVAGDISPDGWCVVYSAKS
ncbi:MAG: high-potential iron-sulfur protein [Candidatus Velthaea sp.]